LSTNDPSTRKAVSSAKAVLADRRLPIAFVAVVIVGALGWALNAWLTSIPDQAHTTKHLGYALGITLLLTVSHFLRRRR
jgi:hypothetical protein